jgi:4-hydroxybenzoate polyprenyltransferase
MADSGLPIYQVGLAISLISFNYIYSLNSIEDRDIDSINKPGRPIPAGKLNLTDSHRYVAYIACLIYYLSAVCIQKHY